MLGGFNRLTDQPDCSIDGGHCWRLTHDETKVFRRCSFCGYEEIMKGEWVELPHD